MKKFYSISLFLFLMALFPRLIEIFSRNHYYGREIGVLFLQIRNMFLYHNFPLISPEVGGIGGFSKPPLFTYLLALGYVFGNENPYSARIIMFIQSILVIIIAYFWGRKLFSKTEIILITFILAISAGLINLAGTVFAPFTIPLLTVVYLFGIYSVFQKKENYLMLALLSLGLIANFELATLWTLLVQLLVFIPYLYKKKLLTLKTSFLSILLFIVPFTPLLLYDLTHQFANSFGIVHSIQATNTNFQSLILSRVETFRWNFVSWLFQNNVLVVIELLILVAGSMLFLRSKISKSKKRFFVFLISTPFISFLSLIFYPGATIFAWWLLHLYIVYSLIFGLLLAHFWQIKNVRKGILIMVFLFFILYLHRSITSFYNEFTPSTNWYLPDLDAVRFVASDANKQEIYVDYAKNQPDLTYLFWWYGGKHHKRFRAKIPKHGIYYSIVSIEPRPKNLKQTLAKKPGKVFLTNYLVGPYVVQKNEIR